MSSERQYGYEFEVTFYENVGENVEEYLMYIRSLKPYLDIETLKMESEFWERPEMMYLPYKIETIQIVHDEE